MTDERKEGQQVSSLIDEIEDEHCACGAGTDHRNQDTWEYCGLHARLDKLRAALTAQPQPRGSEALANAVLLLAKSMNQSNIWALRNEIMELCEGAAATAERTNLATESPVAETVAIGTGDSYAGSQSHQNAAHQPAPPQPEAPEKEKP
jgi:hypothetical protein